MVVGGAGGGSKQRQRFGPLSVHGGAGVGGGVGGPGPSKLATIPDSSVRITSAQGEAGRGSAGLMIERSFAASRPFGKLLIQHGWRRARTGPNGTSSADGRLGSGLTRQCFNRLVASSQGLVAGKSIFGFCRAAGSSGPTEFSAGISCWITVPSFGTAAPAAPTPAPAALGRRRRTGRHDDDSHVVRDNGPVLDGR